MPMRSEAFFLTVALAFASIPAQAATNLYCANGSVGDTTTVTINGKVVTASKSGWTGRGRLSDQSGPAIYHLDFSDGATMAINRGTGDAMLSKLPGGPFLLYCRLGGPRL